MNISRGRFTSTATSSCSDVWFVSFGDLLTLLVCFFLVLTPQTSASKEIQKPNQHVRDSQISHSVYGTNLAQRVVGGALQGIVFPLFRGSTRGAAYPEMEAARFAVQSNDAVFGRQMVVKLCDAHIEEQEMAIVLDRLGEFGNLLQTAQFEVDASCARWRNEFVPYQDLFAVVTFDER